MPTDNLSILIEKLQSFDLAVEQEKIIEENKDKITDLQQQQLLEGRGVDGEYIRPFYSENSYFKTKEAAYRYALWKQRISPNPLRPLDVPNLFITGKYHRSLFTVVDKSAGIFEVKSDDSNAAHIEEVHKNALGLDYDKRLDFALAYTRPGIQKVLKEKIGISF